MPHAISPHDFQEEQDDLLIRQALDPENPFDFDRELEPGEKADDAIDFGDLSDNDLADDEDEGKLLPCRQVDNSHDTLGGIADFLQDEGAAGIIKSEGPGEDDLDDLFRDLPSSPADDGVEEKPTQISAGVVEMAGASELGEEHSQLIDGLPPEPRAPGLSEVQSQSSIRPASLQQLQQELFAMSGSGIADILPPPPENQEELLITLWPKFKRGIIPKFMDLLPPKKTSYIGKKPLKQPKPMQPTKINLDLAYDQEKGFKLASFNNRRIQEDTDRANFVSIAVTTSVETATAEDEDMNSDLENAPIGGVSWQDFQFACGDWDILDEPDPVLSKQVDIGSDFEHNQDVHKEQDLYQLLDDQPAKVNLEIPSLAFTNQEIEAQAEPLPH